MKVGLEIRCAACGGAPLVRRRAYRPRSGIFSKSSVARCTACDLLQVMPRPALDELDAYYQTQYRYAGFEQDSAPYEDPHDVNFRTLSQVECIRELGIKPRSIVDVGCGYGLLLGSLRKAFPNAELFGVEVSERCRPALSALGIQQAHTTLERKGGNPFDRQFELLVCSHVLEHSGDLPRFLSVCHDMILPGGSALFEVPNCEYEYGGDMPHLLFFTPQTLRQTLEQNNFKVLKCQPCGPSIDRWLPGRGQRLRNWVEDYLPLPLSRGLKGLWRLGQRMKGRPHGATQPPADTLAKLREEAKDQAWFRYDQPGFKHSAIRCIVIRKS